MLDLIKVPEKITGIRVIDNISEQTNIGYDLERLFHKISEGWNVWGEIGLNDIRNSFFQGYLDPINSQLILGVDKIAQDYVSHQSLRGLDFGNDWGTGNLLGSLYCLTKEDIESRIGTNEITIGEVNHPLEAGILLSHKISKRDLLNVGDKVICIKHSGDSLFDYQLLHEVVGDLVVVQGMDFSSRPLLGIHRRLLNIEYILQ